jgi:soluble lytic murein transglycosylase-like protein
LYQQPTNSFEKAKQIEELAISIPRNEAKEIMSSIYRWANAFNVDNKLVLAITKIESGFNKYAISSSGAFGLMQVVPSWHKEKVIRARDTLGDPNLFSINTNIYIGTWILKDCIKKHVGVYAALQCYSGGTPGYADKVLKEYNKT